MESSRDQCNHASIAYLSEHGRWLKRELVAVQESSKGNGIFAVHDIQPGDELLRDVPISPVSMDRDEVSCLLLFRLHNRYDAFEPGAPWSTRSL